MRVAVIGANGQLGSDICHVYKQAGHDIRELNHDKIDITEFGKCSDVLKAINPDLVISTAAMHNVEICEENPEKSFLVNGIGARNLALLSKEIQIPLVHFSTDYIFDGQKESPYFEDDLPIPLNVYGNTKLSGEIFLRNIADSFFIVRVSGLYGKAACRAKGGLNFVQLMLKLANEKDEIRVVDDEVLSPTYTISVAEQLERLTQTDKYGVYHMVSEGSCSWYEFAKKIFELAEIDIELNVAHPDEFPVKVPRPKYSVLSNRNLEAEGLNIMPHWVEGLRRYLMSLDLFV